MGRWNRRDVRTTRDEATGAGTAEPEDAEAAPAVIRAVMPPDARRVATPPAAAVRAMHGPVTTVRAATSSQGWGLPGVGFAGFWSAKLLSRVAGTRVVVSRGVRVHRLRLAWR